MPVSKPLTEPLFTPENIADRLQISLRSVRRLIKSEKIKVMRIGRLIRITSGALEAYMTEAAGE